MDCPHCVRAREQEHLMVLAAALGVSVGELVWLGNRDAPVEPVVLVMPTRPTIVVAPTVAPLPQVAPSPTSPTMAIERQCPKCLHKGVHSVSGPQALKQRSPELACRDQTRVVTCSACGYAWRGRLTGADLASVPLLKEVAR